MAIAVVPVLGLLKPAGPAGRSNHGLRAELENSLLAGFRGSASSGSSRGSSPDRVAGGGWRHPLRPSSSSGSSDGSSSRSDGGDKGGNAGRPPEDSLLFEKKYNPLSGRLRVTELVR